MKLIHEEDLYIGTSSERTTNFPVSPDEGVSFYETDTGSLYKVVFSNWVEIGNLHDVVTLEAVLESNLLGITGQELTLDDQAETKVFAGPSSGGGSGSPSFRDLDVDDIPDDVVTLSVVLDSNLLDKVGNELDLDAQSPNTFLAGSAAPSGPVAAPAFRSIVPADLPAATRASYITPLRSLTALRGLWISSHIDTSGNLYDLSGNGLNLTNNTVVFQQEGGIPAARLFSISPSYFEHIDDPAFDISGSESYVTQINRGLSTGGLFYVDTISGGVGTEVTIISKSDDAANPAYSLVVVIAADGNPYLTMRISDGTDSISAVSDDQVPYNQWVFLGGNYDVQSDTVGTYVNDAEQTQTFGTSLGNINNNSEPFLVGALSDGAGGTDEELDGRVAFVFLCASSLSTEAFQNIYYGVEPLL